MKKLRSMVLSLFLFMPTFQVQAAGIPVIDVASIAEQVRAFVQQMQDYQALLDQLSVQNSQYTQMLADYNQVITEYNHYLNQIRELNLSSSQLAAIDQVANATYGNKGISYLPGIDLSSPTATDDTAVILRDSGYIPRDRGDVITDYQALNPDSTSYTEERYDYLAKQSEAYENQMYMVQQNEAKQSDIFQDKINTAREVRRSLGPESDLQTAQHIAEQQGIMMEQFQEIARLQNQSIMIYESPSQAHNRRKIEALEAEIQRLERVKATRDSASPQPVINGYGELF